MAPATTVTLESTVAAEALLLDSVTTIPLAGAAVLRFTVAVEELPPVAVDGLTLTEERVTAEITKVTVAECDRLPLLPVRVRV